MQADYKKLTEDTSNFLNNNGNNISDEDTIETIGQKVNDIAIKNFWDGVYTKFVKVAENSNTRYAQTIDFTSIDNYKNFTMNDIVIVNKAMTYANTCDNEDILTMSKSYNPDNGMLSTGKQKSYCNESGSVWTFWNTFDVYVLK